MRAPPDNIYFPSETERLSAEGNEKKGKKYLTSKEQTLKTMSGRRECVTQVSHCLWDYEVRHLHAVHKLQPFLCNDKLIRMFQEGRDNFT